MNRLPISKGRAQTKKSLHLLPRQPAARLEMQDSAVSPAKKYGERQALFQIFVIVYPGEC